jgi:hypothetical protein
MPTNGRWDLIQRLKGLFKLIPERPEEYIDVLVLEEGTASVENLMPL